MARADSKGLSPQLFFSPLLTRVLGSITAVTDLTEELRKDAFTMDAASESKIVDSILRLLQDSAKEVQDVTVKSLGPLVRKVGEQHVTNIINQLAENIALTKRGTQEVREVSNSGLKAVLKDVDEKLGERVSSLLAPGLIKAIKLDNLDVQQECLDVINDLLVRFGASTNPKQLQEIQDTTVPLLDSSRNLIRQRAIWVLTNVAKVCPEPAFQALSAALLKKMGGEIKKQSTAIQLVGSIARNVGFRMGPLVNDFVPLLAAAVNKSSAEGDEDIKENAFQTFGSFVESCPRDIRPHIDTLVSLSLKFLAWDPNQLDDDEGGDEGSGSGGDNDDEGDGSDSGMEASEDEDDKTWMVRRAAAKIITSLVNNHPERLKGVIEKAAPELVKQFKERESCTRHEVLGSYEAMAVAVEHSGRSSPAAEAFGKTTDKAISALAQLLSHKSADTRIAAVSVLRSLNRFAPASLGKHLKELVPGVGAGVTDSNPQLRITSLDLLRLIPLGSPAEVEPLLEALFAPLQKVLSAGATLHSRVATAALNACEAFLVAAAGKNEFLIKVYTAFEPLYKQTELDAEAKEAAIRAAARAICNLGQKLPSLNNSLDILVDRLGSELTREAAANAWGVITDSGIAVGDAYLAKAVPLLCSFCAPGARSLKIAALSALASIFEHYGESLKSHTAVLSDVSGLIDVDDFTLAQLAVHVATVAVHSNPKCVGDVKKHVYGRVLTLLNSPLLEGVALGAVADLFRELAMLETKGFGFAELCKDLDGQFKAAYQTKDHHVYRNLGACYAQVIVGGDAKKSAPAVQTLIKHAGSKDDEERIAAIFVLAEVGRSKDVSEYDGLVEALATALDSPVRAVGLAASYGLGSVAVGNLSKYLPYILADMNKNPKRQLLLLQAIKEIVSGQSSAGSNALRLSLSSSLGGTAAQDIAVHLDTLLPILLQHASAQDDLTRNAVSECLGRLAKIAPERIVTELQQRATDKSGFTRACVVNALRYAVTEKPAPELDLLLQKAFAVAASAVADPDILVRLAGMQAVKWALQTKPRIVKEHLAVALPAIYKETVIDQSLIRVIDLGQIKHVTDHGLDKRTAAYELLYVMLDTAFDAISTADYFDPILRAQSSDEVLTIKELSFNILRRMAQVAGGQLYAHLDKILPELNKEVKRPIPKSEPGDRILVMKRAALQACIALNAIPNASSHAKLQEIMQKSIPTGPFKDEYEALLKAKL